MNGLWDHFSMCHAVASQFVSHDLSWIIPMGPLQTPEETFRSSTIPTRLQININDVAILINRLPQIILFTTDLHEDFIDE